MKKCCSCKKQLDISEFNKNKSRKDGINSICRICSNQRSKKYYQENRNKHIKCVRKNNKKYKLELKEFVDQIKQSDGCQICKENNLCCLQFHHLDPTIKDENISILLRKVRKKRLLEEIKKCIVLCANCHFKVHAGILTVKTYKCPH